MVRRQIGRGVVRQAQGYGLPALTFQTNDMIRWQVGAAGLRRHLVTPVGAIASIKNGPALLLQLDAGDPTRDFRVVICGRSTQLAERCTVTRDQQHGFAISNREKLPVFSILCGAFSDLHRSETGFGDGG